MKGAPGAPCGRLPAYRRACGNLRLWSGAATQGAHERVRRSRQGTPVRFAVFGPGIPCLQAWGGVKLEVVPAPACVAHRLPHSNEAIRTRREAHPEPTPLI